MTLAIIALIQNILPFAGDPAVFSPLVIVQMLAQLSMLAMAIDYMRHEDAIENPHGYARRAGDRR